MGCGCGKSTSAVTPVPSGKRKSGRPTLAELQELNRPGPDELGSATAAVGFLNSADDTLRSGPSCLRILESNTVLVAMRVRPLNQRELGATSSKTCLSYDGVTGVSIQRGDEKAHKFAFDCVLREDSFQQDVFDRTGRPLLHKVLEGYNGCLFAYGQTGSGKTFTMQGEGTGEQEGLVPRLCNELFHQVEQRSATRNITVSMSVVEIYNEHIKSLLSDDGDDLQIREAVSQRPSVISVNQEAAATGRSSCIYVEGAEEVAAASARDVLSALSRAQARRVVGKTNMNEHSSRSHSVVTLRISCSDVDDVDGVTGTVSKLHLIDLAGSERQKATGASGDRLKEGAQINLSLSALGNVISALTEPGSRGRHVPYRDSKLTRLLQDSLGGNSYTVMICNVSPAQINAEETMSSLRFAERAKKVKNQATVNRDPKNQRILELLKENKALRARCDRLEKHVMRLEEHYD
jgi:kinesin family protein 3/17